jgi:uncharacterized protein YtpQ (UPF0354 family)
MSLLKKIFGKSSETEKSSPETESLFITYKEKIYPWIKVTFTAEEPNDASVTIKLSAEDSPIMKNWLGDLAILYVADTGNSFQVILERDLPKEMTKKELRQLAVNNLNRDVEYKLNNTNFGGYMLVAGGDHEAGSICLPELWEWIAEHLDDNLIVAIAAKDLVMIVPERDPDKVSNLKIFVHEIFKDGERLLTRNIFRYDKNSKDWTLIDKVS